MEPLIMVFMTVAPFGLAYFLQRFGGRRGWRLRPMACVIVAFMWLWYTTVLGVNGGMGVFGFVVAAVFLAPFHVAGYFFGLWTIRDKIKREDERRGEARSQQT